MAAPIFHSVVQGESLAFELRLVGEVLDGADVWARTSSGLSADDFSLSVVLPDTVRVSAPDTGGFSLGIHDLFVWVEYPSGETDRDVIQNLIEVIPRVGGA